MTHRILAAIFATVTATAAQAVSIPLPGQPLPVPPESSFNAVNYNFEGIIGFSNCSGSLVRFDDSQDTDLALVLSNGHCVDLLKPGVVVVNKPNSRSVRIYDKAANALGSVQTKRIVYATMTDTDASIYELKNTYKEIEARFNIRPLTLSREVPTAGTDIEIISGYWRRGYACQIESTVPVLKEGDWTFTKSLRYSRPGCETIGGTSGSPIIAAGTRTVIAVNNTGNESGQRCTMNNPCEVDENGNVTFEKGLSYGQQTYGFYTCRNANGDLDLAVEGCILPKPTAR